jgi:hypothetical protein
MFLYAYVAPDEDTREAYFFNLENRKKRGGKFSRSKEYDVIPGGSWMWFKVCNGPDSLLIQC